MSSTVSKESVEAAATLIQQARAMRVSHFKFGELEVHFETEGGPQAATVARNPFAPDIAPGAPAQNFNPASDDPEDYFAMRAAIASAVAGSAQRE